MSHKVSFVTVFQILALLIYLHQSTCSVVIDYLSQKDPNIAKYCPKTEYCDEGAHVMCMFNNPKEKMGPSCSNSQNISMTPDIAHKLLEVSNAVRSRIALGREVGKNGPLPRGYGMFRLSWDEELATFAQVLANQCVLTRDLCRATNKFPDPEQVIGLVRFSFPDWLPVSNKSHFVTSNLTAPKLNYAMTQTMKTWYSQKNYVTSEMILQYPDFEHHMRSQYGKLYLKMIYGPATHMGCGISAYTQFAYHDNNSPLNYNVVCNYSTGPKSGLQVYTTTAPTQIGFTVKCGCPEGYDEDADCLCFESRKPPAVPSKPPNYCSDDSCKQSVVLLPIFTVEDAPPHELLPSLFSNHSRRIEPPRRYNKMDNYKAKMQIVEPQNLNEFTKLLKGTDFARSNFPVVQHRYNQGIMSNKQLSYTKPNVPTLSHVPRKYTGKHSIFSRAEKFQLPTRKIDVSYKVITKDIKKDVAPRKDFSSVQKLLKSYLNNKRNHAGNIFNGKNYEYTSNEPVVQSAIVEHVPVNNLRKKSKVTDPYRILSTNSKLDFGYQQINTTNDIKDIIVMHTNDNPDKKIMTLLDNLEKEVNYLQLDSTDKEIFDSRIRKIYGKIVGNEHDFRLQPIQIKTNNRRYDEKINENLVQYETVANNEVLNKGILKKKPSGGNKLNLYDDNGLIKRDQNSIRTTDNVYRSVYKDYKPDSNNIKDFYTKNDRSVDDLLSYDRRKYYQDKLDDLQRKRQRIRTNSQSSTSNRSVDDHLSYDRRTYYQDKLDDLQKKRQKMRTNRQSSVNSPRHVMPVRPTKVGDMLMRPSKSKQIDTFYIPDRARFIHGF